MIAGAGGAMRATGWRATATRSQQFGRGGLRWHRSLERARARGQRRACEIDLRDARPAPAACAALCVAMDGGRAADVDGLLVPIDRRRLGAAPAMMVPTRRGATQHDTRRHPATSVSLWDGDR